MFLILYLRFLANEFNLAGRSNLERAQADEIIDTLKDLFDGDRENNVPAILQCNDEEKKKEKIGKLKERTKEFFDRLTKRLEAR